jgi:hypothetical protein
MKLPIDFEEKVKLPPPANGAGYPYQLSAKDLMDNFKYAALQVDTDSGLAEIKNSDGTRTVSLEGSGASGSRTLRDVDGNIAWQILWVNGLIISTGNEEYQDVCDCDNNSSI